MDDNTLLRRLDMVSITARSLIFVLGTIGNGLVIFITGFRMKKTVHSVWILNLAIADFTFCFFLLFNIVYIGLDHHWPFGDVMCKLSHTVVSLNLFASIYFLTGISLDRCIAVWCPVWARNHRTPRLASIVVLGIWILALTICFPNLFLTETSNAIHKNITYCVSFYSMIDASGKVGNYSLVIIQSTFGFFIPICIIFACYGAIAVRLRRDQLSQSSKPFKVITAVIVAFFVCWFPFHFFPFLAVKVFYETKLHVVMTIGLRFCYCLAFFNSCLNPILYFCMGHNFKEKLSCSLLSALANAFTEESNPSNTKTKVRSCAELESGVYTWRTHTCPQVAGCEGSPV